MEQYALKAFADSEQELLDKVIREGVMVFRGPMILPFDDEPHLTQLLAISFCQKGSLQIRYDMQTINFGEHDVALLMPDHTITRMGHSDDYQAVHIVVAKSFFKEIHFRNPYHYHLQYHREPTLHLSEEQFDTLLHLVPVLEESAKLEGEKRNEMCAAVINLIGEFLMEYRRQQGDFEEQSPNLRLFDRFYEAVTKHYQESHEVKYYANIFCVSPKYFSTVIRQTTGATPSEWIARYIVVRAKMLMRTTDLSMQQISKELGFPDQTSFTRYFKTNAGYPPTAYRSHRHI